MSLRQRASDALTAMAMAADLERRRVKDEYSLVDPDPFAPIPAAGQLQQEQQQPGAIDDQHAHEQASEQHNAPIDTSGDETADGW